MTDELDKLVREIYETWSGIIGYVPWVEGGNSLKQEDARRLAYKVHDAGMKLQRERDAEIADAFDSERGNEKVIAELIRSTKP